MRELKIDLPCSTSMSLIGKRVKRWAGFKEATPAPANDKVLVIVGSAPSVNDFKEEIKKEDGDVLVANAAHQWALDAGIDFSLAAVMDGDKCVCGFYDSPQKGVTYYVASMAHPDLQKTLRGAEVLVWHAQQKGMDRFLKPGQNMVGGGCGIGIRAINLGYMLGYRKFKLYGVEGSDIGGVTYADNTALRREEDMMSVQCDGIWFNGTVQHIGQAQDFIKMLEKHGDKMDVEAIGVGLIPHISRILREKENGVR